MRFQPVKCNIMQTTRKRTNKIEASYTLEGTVLENVDSIKYLGVTITHDLRWNTHISNMCTQANRTLGFLRLNLSISALRILKRQHMGDLFALFWNMADVFLLERNIPKRVSSARNRNILAISQSVVLRQEIEKVQNRAARFVTSNYCFETGSMTGIREKSKMGVSQEKEERQ